MIISTPLDSWIDFRSLMISITSKLVSGSKLIFYLPIIPTCGAWRWRTPGTRLTSFNQVVAASSRRWSLPRDVAATWSTSESPYDAPPSPNSSSLCFRRFDFVLSIFQISPEGEKCDVLICESMYIVFWVNCTSGPQTYPAVSPKSLNFQIIHLDP